MLSTLAMLLLPHKVINAKIAIIYLFLLLIIFINAIC